MQRDFFRIQYVNTLDTNSENNHTFANVTEGSPFGSVSPWPVLNTAHKFAEGLPRLSRPSPSH